jgi:hypothetical protein
MDPISIAIEVELGALLLAVIGGVATWANSRQQKAKRRQRDRHHRELALLREKQHREHMATLRVTAGIAEEALAVVADEVPKRPRPAPRASTRAAGRGTRAHAARSGGRAD